MAFKKEKENKKEDKAEKGKEEPKGYPAKKKGGKKK